MGFNSAFKGLIRMSGVILYFICEGHIPSVFKEYRKQCDITDSAGRILQFSYENNQQDALYRLIYYSRPALHVWSDVFAHHQEHFTVFTASGSIHRRHQPAAT
jgi:hypothetical protein